MSWPSIPSNNITGKAKAAAERLRASLLQLAENLVTVMDPISIGLLLGSSALSGIGALGENTATNKFLVQNMLADRDQLLQDQQAAAARMAKRRTTYDKRCELTAVALLSGGLFSYFRRDSIQ
jgi:hypothetical protein